MAKPGNGGSSSAVTWIWMVAALVVVGLFLVWLGVTSEPSAVAAPELDDDTMQVAAGPAAMTGEPVEASTLAADAQSLIGRQVEVTLPVQAKLGSQLLWMELPTGQPYMVKTDEATAAAQQLGAAVVVVGTVRMKNDSVVSAWRESGVLATDGDAQQAQFGTTFLDAVQIRPAGS